MSDKADKAKTYPKLGNLARYNLKQLDKSIYHDVNVNVVVMSSNLHAYTHVTCVFTAGWLEGKLPQQPMIWHGVESLQTSWWSPCKQ
jgi:hypothetical protein